MHSFARCVIAGALLTVPLAAHAQTATAPRRSTPEMWAMLSAGRGDLQVNCGICRRNDQSSWAADVSIGGWLSKRSTLGGELAAWRLGGEEATQRVTMLSGVSQFYPMETRRGFAKLGVGMMAYRSTDGEQSLSARSLALQVGLGWDFTVAERYVVAPQVGLVQGFNGGLYLDDERVTGASQVKLVRFGLGVGVGR